MLKVWWKNIIWVLLKFTGEITCFGTQCSMLVILLNAKIIFSIFGALSEHLITKKDTNQFFLTN